MSMTSPFHIPTFIEAWEAASGEIASEWADSPDEFVREKLKGMEKGRPSFDDLMLRLAHLISSRSIDPSTRHGAVIVDPQSRILSMGYNGAVQGFPHDKIEWTRPEKYDYMIHAEANAILFAKQDLKGCCIYVTGPSCPGCFNLIAQAGMRRCVFGPRIARCITPRAEEVRKKIALEKNIEIVTFGSHPIRSTIDSSSTRDVPPSQEKPVVAEPPSTQDLPATQAVAVAEPTTGEETQGGADETKTPKVTCKGVTETKEEPPSQAALPSQEPPEITTSADPGLNPELMTRYVLEDALVEEVAASAPLVPPEMPKGEYSLFCWQAWLDSLDITGLKDGRHVWFIGRCGETHGVIFDIRGSEAFGLDHALLRNMWAKISSQVKGFATYDAHGMGVFGCKPDEVTLLAAGLTLGTTPDTPPFVSAYTFYK